MIDRYMGNIRPQFDTVKTVELALAQTTLD